MRSMPGGLAVCVEQAAQARAVLAVSSKAALFMRIPPDGQIGSSLPPGYKPPRPLSAYRMVMTVLCQIALGAVATQAQEALPTRAAVNADVRAMTDLGRQLFVSPALSQ